MARPNKETIDYFSHDTDMSEDERLQKVEFKYGLIGYAIYNKILERAYKTTGDFNLESDEDYKLYASKWRIKSEKLKEIVGYMRELKLFPDTNFISNGIKKRMKKIQGERARKRNYYKKKGVAGGVLDGKNTGKRGDIPNQGKERKGKEIKLNKSIVGEEEPAKDSFLVAYEKPTLEKVKEFFESGGYDSNEAEKFWSYHDSTGWETARGQPIKYWSSKVLGWMNNSKQFNESGKNGKDINSNNPSSFKGSGRSSGVKLAASE